ncbi:MAG: DUF3105 domain-containing protein [Gaiellaceae bacterium]
MAKRKKSRTPAPPTKGRGGRKTTIPGHVTKANEPRQKASSGRTSPLSKLDPRQLRFLLAGGVGLVIIVVVVLAVSLGGGSATGGPGEALAAAGCQLFEPAPGQATADNNHVLELPEGFEYNTFPPSQGPHHPQTLGFDLYPQPVEQLNLVHNLEHGGVYVQYGDQVSAEDIAAIAAWWDTDPNGLVVAPLPALEANIALGAWTTGSEGDYENSVGRLAYCTGFDQSAFDAFKNSYRGLGPERIPVNALTPGFSPSDANQ